MQYYRRCLSILIEGFPCLQSRMEFEICKKALRNRVHHCVL
ncbi:hypothetical protein ACJIZ3_010675 [Penstemon smallii]|uniref:Uncharacterized protein n=1 Tax=Penstemon smallii TaxID=265156 RepID=A0ABD3UL28_9LAMI